MAEKRTMEASEHVATRPKRVRKYVERFSPSLDDGPLLDDFSDDESVSSGSTCESILTKSEDAPYDSDSCSDNSSFIVSDSESIYSDSTDSSFVISFEFSSDDETDEDEDEAQSEIDEKKGEKEADSDESESESENQFIQ